MASSILRHKEAHFCCGSASGEWRGDDELDAIDLKILALLQEDATLSSAQVAELIGVSQSPTWRRINNLAESGAIQRRVAIIDREAVGLDFMVHVLVRLKDQTRQTVESFSERVARIPEIMQCHMLLGDIDFILFVVTKSLPAYQKLLTDHLSTIEGVSGIDSRVAIIETKNITTLPINNDESG